MLPVQQKTLWRWLYLLWLSASVHDSEVSLVIYVNILLLSNSEIYCYLLSDTVDNIVCVHCRFSISHQIMSIAPIFVPSQLLKCMILAFIPVVTQHSLSIRLLAVYFVGRKLFSLYTHLAPTYQKYWGRGSLLSSPYFPLFAVFLLI